MKLIEVVKSSVDGKKWTAIFDNDGRKKSVSFGARGYEDYTQHHDKVRRDLYRKRHAKDLLTHDPTKPGYLSYYLLWGDSTSLSTNISSYKRKFKM